jgi:hypothetical protein
MPPLSYFFWFLMLLWLLGGFWAYRVPGSPYPFERGGLHLLAWSVIAMLGWKVFA